MNGVRLIAEILRREGVELLACYPRSALIDACADVSIRPVICRQERVGVSIADGYTRGSGYQRVGVFACQSGPGIENAYPGLAQAFADGIPLLAIPSGASIEWQNSKPMFSAVDSFASVTKWAVRPHSASDLPYVMARAFHQLRSGKPGPVLVEVPENVWHQTSDTSFDYEPVRAYRSAPDPIDVDIAADKLLAARAPVIRAGQGVLMAGATAELIALAELLGAPVYTTNPGKSAFPENHPLSLGGLAVNPPRPLKIFSEKADLILAVGSSLNYSPFNPNPPPGKQLIHATDNAYDINKDYPAAHALIGDARLTLQALLQAVGDRLAGRMHPPAASAPAAVATAKQAWLNDWRRHFDDSEVPLNPYRVLRDLMQTVDPDNTIITHDAGSPREQLLPFWQATQPGGYLGWGKSTQLGHGLGLILGAKLANPDKVCINCMGDAAFCMVGLDLDTAVRNRIATLSIVLNNGVMASEHGHLVSSREKFDVFGIGGNYSQVAAALGCWSRRVEQPGDIVDAIREAIAVTTSGKPALLEFIIRECYDYSD